MTLIGEASAKSIVHVHTLQRNARFTITTMTATGGSSMASAASAKLDELVSRDLLRTLVPTSRLGGARCVRGPAALAATSEEEAAAGSTATPKETAESREGGGGATGGADGNAPGGIGCGPVLLSFSCNDYLGLSHHAEVVEASVAAARVHGVGAGGSRLITGNHVGYAALEAELAALKGTEDCVVFGSGYLANAGAIGAVVGPRDWCVVDALCHACIMQGVTLARCLGVTLYAHNDVSDCEARVAAAARAVSAGGGRVLVCTETVFSMDGDLAPVAALSEVCRRHGAWLMTDDAHGVLVIGDAGQGGVPQGAHVDLQAGTLSKAVGSYGGYVACAKAIGDLLRTRARTFVYSTGLPPAVTAASLAAIRVARREPDRRGRARARAALFASLVPGCTPAPAAAIVPLIVGAERAALDAQAGLLRRGFLVGAIRPPTVPAGTSRLRFTFSADHAEDDVRALAAAVLELVPASREARARL